MKNVFRVFDYIVSLVLSPFVTLSKNREDEIEMPTTIVKHKKSKKTRFVPAQSLNLLRIGHNEKITLLFNKQQQNKHNYLFDGLCVRRRNRMLSGRLMERSENLDKPGSFLYRFQRGDGSIFVIDA